MSIINMNPEEIIDKLPHGSGIDGEWSVEKHTENHLVFRNDYHCMNPEGFYDGWLPLRVIIFSHKKDVFNQLTGSLIGKQQVLHRVGDIDFRIQFRESAESYLYGTKDYLNDIFYDSLKELLTHRYEII